MPAMTAKIRPHRPMATTTGINRKPIQAKESRTVATMPTSSAMRTVILLNLPDDQRPDDIAERDDIT
jgi:hypothetical protein